MRDLLAGAGLSPRDVLSTRAKAFKELVGERDLDDDELLKLMVQEPTLLRRPLAIKDGNATIGFDKAAYTTLAKD